MPKFRLLALFFAALALSACGPSKVNLRSVADNMGNYQPAIDSAQEKRDARAAELAIILKKTSTPSHSSYVALKSELAAMDKAIAGMKTGKTKVDAYKPKFEAYAEGKGVISEEDAAAWAEYKQMMAGYSPLASEVQSHVRRFNAAQTQFQKILDTHNIKKMDVTELRAEIEAIGTEVKSGVDDMEAEIPAGRKTLDFAKKAGGDADLIASKVRILDEMAAKLPGMRLFRSTVTGSQDRALRDLTQEGELWSGPGMATGTFELVEQFRDVRKQYRANRQAWDQQLVAFEAVAQPTPVPTAAP